MNDLVEKEVVEVVKSAASMLIDNQDGLSKATNYLKWIVDVKKKVKESCDPKVEDAYRKHKEETSKRTALLAPLEGVEKQIKDAIVTYNKRVEAESQERIRLINEDLAKQAELNKQDALKNAEALTNEWEAEVAKEKAQAMETVQLDQPKKVLEQEGLSIRKTWKARVVDGSVIPREYLIINESALNLAAKNEELRIKGIKGVEFYQEQSASVR